MQALRDLFEKQEENLLKIRQLTTVLYEASQEKNIEGQESIEAMRETLIQSGDKTYQQVRDFLETLGNIPDISEEPVTAYFEEKKASLIKVMKEIISVDQLRAKALQSELKNTKDEILNLRLGKNAANKYEIAAQSTL